MARIIWTVPALQELDEIADYISLDNPNAAKKLVRDVFNTVDRLQQHPWSGKSVEELNNTAYRRILISPCQIYYRVNDDLVYIIHVIRDEQLTMAYRLQME